MSLLSLGLVLFILSNTQALQITPGSSCSSVCQSSSATEVSDIVCADVDYYSSSRGDTFKDCIQCLQTSNATSDSENDVSWFLYNLRYASAVCLYDFPKHRDNSTSSCDLEYACSPLQEALESGNLQTSNRTEYGYCQADSSAFYGTVIDDCVSCLQSSSSNYMANFLLALKAGCEQQPAAGQILSVSGDIFSENAINITSTNNFTSANTTSSQYDGEISTASKIGIGISLSALFLAAIILFVIYWRRQRQYEDENKDTNPYRFRSHYYYPKEPDSGSAPMSTAQNFAMQNYTVDYKSQLSGPTVTTTPEPEHHQQPTEFPTDFLNNAEYYDRLEGKSRGRPLKALPLRLHPTRISSDNDSSVGSGAGTVNALSESDSALPIHPAYIPRSNYPGQLGGRASRKQNNTSGPPPLLSSQQPASKNSSLSAMRQEWRTSNTQDSYAIQVYLNAAEEPSFTPAPPSSQSGVSRSASPRNLRLELANRSGDSPYDDSQRGVNTNLQYPPPSIPPYSRGSPVPPPPPQDRRGTPAPLQFKDAYSNQSSGERSRRASFSLSSLILPSVPRIRVPSDKKSPPQQQPPLRADGSLLFNRDIALSANISGPLAFPDGRFAARPGRSTQDRIIEQTVVDRAAPFREIPIGSGKSYLYG